MKSLPVSLCALIAVFSATAASAGSFDVTQHHKNPSRDGLYIDPAFTSAAAGAITRDLNFDGTIVGDVYAQPLYIENGPGGASMVIAVTESNNVYALNAITGAIIWQRNVGSPITAGLPCGNINPLGITGTPVVDIATRSLFLNAETTPGAGTYKHLIFSLNVDTGDINSGWPVDTAIVVPGFDSSVQGSRAALGLVGNIVYVPYGGRAGDCGDYRGRVVGVSINNPTTILNWATTALRGGIWAVGGVASDGIDIFVTTGNTVDTAGNWGGGEAAIRLQPGPVFSGSTTDYWAPTNWLALDNSDVDLGGSGPILVDVPGAHPSALVVALGKDGNAYLLNRANLGGITAPVSQSPVGAGVIIQAAATYRTVNGTYVVFRRTSGTLTAFKITEASPPMVATGWTVNQSGRGSPFVTTTDGTNEPIVWVVGAEGDERLHGYNGNTGATIFGGGGANELMSGTRKFNTGIAARGRIYVTADNKVYAFAVPAGATPTPSPPPPSPTEAPPLSFQPAMYDFPPLVVSSSADQDFFLYCGTIECWPNVVVSIEGSSNFSITSDFCNVTPTPIPGQSSSPELLSSCQVRVTFHPSTAGPSSATLRAHGNCQCNDAVAHLTGIGIACTDCPTPTPAASPAKALNIATRLRVEGGSNVAIGGFIVTGNGNKNVIVRGIGPSLNGAGVTDALADPTLELRGSNGSLILSNDDWQDDASQAEQITAAGLAPTDIKESAIAATLAAGDAYTVILAGKNQSAGVGLVEMYDVNPSASSQLANLSTRGFVQTGSNVVIGGFILGETNGASRVIVRGIGPSLAGIGLDPLQDPTLELYDGNGVLIVANNNWQDDPPSASLLTLLGLAPTNDHESGIYRVLGPGMYTAILAGNDGGTGIGVVEIYNVQ